jgi:release factor glutamine methyltransferase
VSGFLTVREALRQGAEILGKAGEADARRTARVLLGHAMGEDWGYLLAHPEQELTELDWIHYGRYLHQRTERVPVQYITGRQEFYGREFRVTRAVLIPRPETEQVVEESLGLTLEEGAVVDVGTGSGAMAVTIGLERGLRVIATDVSAEALEVARRNASRWEAPVDLARGDLLTALRPGGAALVVSNPPYISDGEIEGLQPEVKDYEPRLALSGGATGTEVYARLIGQAGEVLRPGGWLVLELGHDSAAAVREMLQGRFADVRIAPDLAGIPRVAVARLP